MSFLGAVGYIMDGSGLKQLWSTIYAANSVDKMLSGPHFTRALRVHMLTHTALAVLILEQSNLAATDTDSVNQNLSEFLQNSIFDQSLLNLPELVDIENKIRAQVTIKEK